MIFELTNDKKDCICAYPSMKCTSAEAESSVYRKIDGKSAVWYVKVGQGQVMMYIVG